MLLRSISKHLQAQNWFAVCLDFLIVIIGVYIGIQAANWNEESRQAQKAKSLVQRMTIDLENDQQVMQSLIDYKAVVRNYGKTAIAGFAADNDAVSDEQFVISAYQASQVVLPWSYSSAYSELINSGTLDLVENSDLKTMILGYYSNAWAKNTNTTMVAPYRENIRRAIPDVIQDRVRNECGDILMPVAASIGATLPTTCDLDLPDELFREVAQYLRTQSDLLLDLNFQMAVYHIQVNNLTAQINEAQALVDAIAMAR
ncbi:MAG: hypothetical protein DHS20C11_20930 [Lysobacteraceae bacterium]|nr:MAG: hypothetical protein DHS20C11_20930 [Xanthomonadaceae bacterium]